jgi:hypothetical protein
LQRSVVLFTKPPTPGRVKTRLIGELSAEQAAALHAAFLGDVIDELLTGSLHLQVAWALEDDGAGPALDLLPRPVASVIQRGADLGERLYHALSSSVRLGYAAVAAVGSDQPELSVAVVEGAFARLEAGATDVVLEPAHDGGYTLIALRSEALRPELFEAIPWSGPEVLATTLERCRELGLEVELMAPVHDIDTPADLAALCQRLSRSNDVGCPRTRALLERWGRVTGAGA